MNIPYKSLAAFAVLSVLIIGAGAFYDSDKFDAVGFLVDAFVFFAVLAIFFSVFLKRMGLPVQILVAMILGVAAGWLLTAVGKQALVTDYIAIFGELFILLLKMVVVPLVFVSVLLGVAGLGDIRKVGALGGKTIGYYLGTTGIAVIIGLLCVNLIAPGKGLEDIRGQLEEEQAALQAAEEAGEAGETPSVSTGMTIQKTVLPGFFQSPVRTDSNGVPILAIIMFALLLGAALTANGEKSDTAIKMFQGIDTAMVTLVLWIMTLAPIGVFALMAKAIATLGIDYVVQLAAYVVTVFAALIIHFAVLVFLIARFAGGVPPMRFLKGMAPAFELAFSTSSSSATLPVTIQCVTERVGVNQGVARFVLPIGATINMDGTALYTTVASIFVAQVYGLDMGFEQQIMIFLTATIVSVGTAGIPGASLALMSVIFTAVGIPLEGIGLVAGVDRILDMCRTTVNITGDSVGAAVIARSEGEALAKLAT
jgi:Na+/H+-dicarboxylate symporter